ncbi:MAG: L,D-transpeptidase family protein [Oscillospiraceae bacterium]|nr:L,D-transpeptidase family protein [Oscillospiraceae bacterium]
MRGHSMMRCLMRVGLVVVLCPVWLGAVALASSTAMAAAATVPSPVAKPTTSAILVDGEQINFDAYNIAGCNYLKLRDLAYALSGGKKQFDVTWDGGGNTIRLFSGRPYTPVGGEMQTKGDGNKSPSPTTSDILLDGRPVSLPAFNIGGNNYFKLRDIAAAIGFGVLWDGRRNTVVIDTRVGYTPETSGGPDTLPPDASQLVVVKSVGSRAQVYLYEKGSKGLWTENKAYRVSGWVGAAGVKRDKREGDKATPSGQYRIGEAFYIDKAPKTKLDVFKITKNTYWVDDPNSAYYNQRVEGTKHKDWKSAEYMIQYKTAYKYGFVIEYNTARVPGAGSAVFFHVGARATSGCVAVREADILLYLKVLDRAKNPHIIVM